MVRMDNTKGKNDDLPRPRSVSDLLSLVNVDVLQERLKDEISL